MTYTIFDTTGNAIEAFDDAAAARAALRAIVEGEPEAADHLYLIGHDANGCAIGPAETYRDLPESSFTVATVEFLLLSLNSRLQGIGMTRYVPGRTPRLVPTIPA